jgi:hypothetical protein
MGTPVAAPSARLVSGHGARLSAPAALRGLAGEAPHGRFPLARPEGSPVRSGLAGFWAGVVSR